MTAHPAKNTPVPPPPAAQAPLLDLGRLLVGIRRRRRLWVAAGLLGLLIGGALAFLMPPMPTAVARVIIIHESDQPSDTGTLMRTDVALFQTARIASATLDKMGVEEPADEFLKTYTGTGLTSNVMEIAVTGRDDADAVVRAQALAEVFVADHIQRLRTGAEAESKALVDQRGRAQAELDEVDAAITSTPTNVTGAAATELEARYARRAELISQISELGRRAEEASIGAPKVAAGTQVVDAARALDRSAPRTAVTNAGLGLVLGTVIGLALAAVSGVVRDKPVLRKEISAHLGASVIAQLPAPRRWPARLLWRRKAAAERKRVAATLVRAVGKGQGSVSLLELGTAGTAAELAVDMAAELATSGPVVVIDSLPKHNLLALAEDPDHPVRILDGDLLPLPVWPWERHIGVGSVAPGTPWTDLSQLGTETILVVRAGFANTAWLHTVARQLADLGVPVMGVVLVGPDPKDRSDGTLWDGLHTALRGRAGRRNGTKPEFLPNNRALDPPTERFGPVGTGQQGRDNLANSAEQTARTLAPVRMKPDNGEVT